MLLDDGVPTDRDQGRHIGDIANDGPAAGDGSPAAHLSGLAIDQGETDEGGDPPAIELAEFGQVGD